MSFSALSVGELAALVTALSAIVIALYLLDRRRQKKIVPSLLFWPQGAGQTARRKRVREPVSLGLQLLALLLLLGAAAGPELGKHPAVRDHLLILDTSAWTAERNNDGSILDREKAAAKEYTRGISPVDRIMVARADSLIVPLTPFTQDQSNVEHAIDGVKSTRYGLDLGRMVAFAAGLRRLSGDPVDAVYFGPGMISAQAETVPTDAGLQVIKIAANRENCGIRRIVALRDTNETGLWRIIATIQNYGQLQKRLEVHAWLEGSGVSERSLAMPPHSQKQITFAVHSLGGRFVLAIEPHDALEADDRTDIMLPAGAPAHVSVYTDRQNVLRSVFESDSRLAARFYAPSQYSPDRGGILVFDQCSPGNAVKSPALWIDPPRAQSPLPVRATASQAALHWNASPEFAAGGNSPEVVLPHANVFQIFEGDLAVASVAAGPVAVARPGSSGGPKEAVIGFDPFASVLRSQIAMPLLVARIMRWLAPQAFGPGEVDATPADEQVARSGNVEVQPVLADVGDYEWGDGAETSRIRLSPGLGDHVLPLWKWFASAGAVVLAIEWLLFGRRKRSYLRLVLKAAALAAITASIALPVIHLPSGKTAVAVLADVSASTGARRANRVLSGIESISRHVHGNWMRVIPFAADVMESRRGGEAGGNLAAPERQSTNIESALVEGAAALPDGYLPRLVLVSDGFENRGSAQRALVEIGVLRPRVDVIPVAAGEGGELRLKTVELPEETYAGERIPIAVSVDAAAPQHGTVALWSSGKQLGCREIDFAAGMNRVFLEAHLDTTGVVPITVRIQTPTAEASAERAIRLLRAHMLVFSHDNEPQNFTAALRAAAFDVTFSDRIPNTLDAFELLVLNDVDLSTLTSEEKQRVAEYVTNGGGLLIIAGDRQKYRSRQQADALARVMPAELAPPNNSDSTAVALIIDKSSSMEGRKIELARLSAIGVVDHLKPRDLIGVLMFDNSYQWAVSMRRAGDKTAINRSIAGITPDGGTQIAPALKEAFRRVLDTKAAYKHIVLLTDGISEEGDSFELARKALDQRVTISTVGLGLDVNRSYLQKIAEISGGHSYFLSDPGALQQIVLKDVEKYTGTSSVTKSLKPLLNHPAEIATGTGVDNGPPLKGYARFLAKPDADVVLSIDADRKDPLYAEWQYGLGRVAIFTSDATDHWAEAWLGWPGFDRFWINVAHELIERPTGEDAEAQLDPGAEKIEVRYRLRPWVKEPSILPEIFAIGPGGFERMVAIEKAAPGVYEGHVSVGEAQGLYRLRPLADSEAFPETGLTTAGKEANAYGTNTGLLSQIAEATGGHINPAPESVFDAEGRAAERRVQIWPLLLAFAIALGVAELIVRKWSGIAQTVRFSRRLLPSE
jgi:Ca-activated chloride channel family protein